MPSVFLSNDVEQLDQRRAIMEQHAIGIGGLFRISVETVDCSEPVCEAARRMHEYNTGSLIVVDEHHAPVGIVTDRDLAVRVLGQHREPGDVRVCDIMTPNPATTTDDASYEEALESMRIQGVRRMPVVDATGRLVGVISLDDFLVAIHKDLEKIAELLRWATPARPALSL